MRPTTTEIKQKYGELAPEEFIYWLTDEYLESIGGQLTAENMAELNTDQHSLLAYRYILDEVMEGGYIQLIINGFAGYILEGPFPYVVKKNWDMKKFSKHLYEVKSAYHKNIEVFEKEYSDEDFMALYEEQEELNDLGDEFLDDFQEETTPQIAEFVYRNAELF